MYLQPSHSERVSFGRTYPSLSSLLATYIEGTEEGWTLEKSLQAFLDGETSAGQADAVAEGRAFLAQRELPWTLIRDRSNIHQETEENARVWLAAILDRIEQSLQQKADQADAQLLPARLSLVPSS